MLATFRSDPIPLAFKARHVSQVTKKLFNPKPVFKSWQQDTMESLKRCMDYDLKLIDTENIVFGDAKDAASLLRNLS